MLPDPIYAQAQANWWFFGENAGIDFNSGSPVAVTGSIETNEGTSVISDASGNLLFYSDGQQVYDQTHTLMPNGDSLLGHWSATQSALIVQKPGSATEYFLFTVQGAGLNYNYDGTAYSVVDMTLNGGLGDVVPGMKNIPILGNTDEKLVAVRHANGCDVWILMHGWQSDAFYAYLLTNAGLNNTPVVTNIGSVYNASPYGFLGYLQPNPDGTKLAACIHEDDYPVELFDFDNLTGELSNFQQLPITGGAPYGACFSPDGTKLYASYYDIFSGDDFVCQWDMAAVDIPGSQTVIHTSLYNFTGALQRGPDGKIYVTSYDTYSLDAINNPNAAGLACDYLEDAVPLLPFSTAKGGLPNIFVSEISSDSVFITVTNCQAPYTLTATPGFGSYLWNTGDTTASITALTDGTYWVEAIGTACYPGTAYDTVVLSGVTVPQLLGADTTVCDSAVTLTAVAGWNNYTWSTGQLGPSIVVTQTGIYWVEVNDSVNNCSFADTVNVQLGSGTGDLLGPDVTVCEIDLPLELNAAPGWSTYLWQDGTTGSTFAVTTGGTYSVTAGNGLCITSDTIVVNAIAAPTLELGNDVDTCVSGGIALTAAGGTAPYLWNTGDTAQTIIATASGEYWVLSGGGGCLATDTVNVSIGSPFTLDLGPDTGLCVGQSLVLQPNVPGASFVWQNGSTDSSVTVTASGLFVLTATLGTCVVTDSIAIEFAAEPVVNLGNDTTLCTGETLLLDAGNAGAVYLWNTGETTQTVGVSTAGVYGVTVINDGCESSDSMELSYLNTNAGNLGGGQTICLDDAVILDAGVTGAVYLWSTGSTEQTLTVSQSGEYAVTVSSSNCVFVDSVVITTVPAADVNLGPDTILCQGSSLTLDAGVHPGATVLWSNGSTSQILQLEEAPQVVWLQVAQGNCTVHDTLVVEDTVCVDDGAVCLFVPNAFSPNGDQHNDDFRIIHCGIENYEINIYNRWGEMVFHSNDPNAGWDGTFRNRPAPLSVYAYYLSGALRGERAFRKGNVTLMR